MRKLRSAADIDKARRRNNIILGVAMIVLLVGSSLGFALMSSDGGSNNAASEMGLDFVRDGGSWKVLIADQVFAFRYLPSEVEDVYGDLSIELGAYSGQPLYFVNPGEGMGEILANLDRYILRYQEACFASDDMTSVGTGNETDCEGDLPVKDCSSNLIIFEEGDETSIYSEGNCVFIAGDDVMGSDAFLYEVLGIR